MTDVASRSGEGIALGRQVLAIAADAGISKFATYWNVSLSMETTAITITMTMLTDMVSCPTADGDGAEALGRQVGMPPACSRHLFHRSR